MQKVIKKDTKPTAKEVEVMVKRLKNIIGGKGLIILIETDVTEKTGGLDLASQCTAFAHGLPKGGIVKVLGNILEQMNISPFDFLVERIMS